MEIIYLSGYTENEKMAIARGYLIPRQIRENSLRDDEILHRRSLADAYPPIYARGGCP
jgi:ATP-dependent Lon protease